MKWILVALASVVAFGQGTPPPVSTTVVRLTPTTRLAWDANTESDIAGYWAQMAQGTTSWRSFTTNTFIPLLTLNSNVQSGTYSFTVTAVNRDGLESQPSAVLTTNLSKPPGVTINLRLEVSLQ